MSWGFPYPPSLSSSLLGVGYPCSSSVYLPPLAPSFLTSPSPCFDFVSFPSLYPPLLSPRLPPLVDFFLLGIRLIPVWGVGSPSAFGGGSLYPPFLFATVASATFALIPVAYCFRILPPILMPGLPLSLIYVISSVHLLLFFHLLLLGLPIPSFRLRRCSPLFLR